MILLLVLAIPAGCAKNYTPAACEALDPEFYAEPEDSFESYNRAMFKFNLEVDRTLIAPTARLYREKANKNLQSGVSNFFDNLKEPRNFVAATLMGNAEGMVHSSMRFTLNSTIGLGGIFDVGEAAGVEYADYDFGQVMGYWGIGSGPYIILPIFGPATPRSMAGSWIDHRYTYIVPRIDKSEHQTFVQYMQWLDIRARLFPLTDALEEQPDPYIFLRESYRQTRLNRICSP